MRTMKILAAGALAALMAAPAVQAADPLVIGMFGPMSGERSALGLRFREAAEMFTDEINEAGGIGGRMLEIRAEDSRGSPREAAAIAQKFADDSEILAVVGGQTSTESMAAGPILADAELTQISPTAGHPDYVKISEYQFRTTPTHASLVQPHVTLLTDHMGMKKIALVYFNDDWGLVTSEMVSESIAKDTDAEVVLNEAMIPATRDFRPLITKILSAEPDGIFLASHYGESALFMQQLRQADPDIKVASTSTLTDPKFIELSGGAAEGVIMPTPFLASAPAAAEFSKKYEALYDKEPNYYSAFSYDAFFIIAEAMKAIAARGEEITRAAIRDQVANAEPLEGVSGTLKYEGTGDLGPRKINYIMVKGDTYVPSTEKLD